MPEHKTYTQENDEIKIDFTKIFNIIWYRKKIIIVCYTIIILLAIAITSLMPKKYTSEAKLLINKSRDTNLAEINPFVLEDGSKGSGLASSLLSNVSSGGIDDDIQIIKSPLVFDKVIIENNLKYSKGPKKGQYISAKDALNKNVEIENKKGTNIINISYKTDDPKLSYNLVKSIIDNYKKFNEELNMSKATKDREFLEDYYLQTKAEFDKKAEKIKAFKLQKEENLLETPPAVTSIYQALLSKYDKRLSSEYKKYPESTIENKKIDLEVEQETEKLNKLKTRYEWSILVEQMAKNTNKIIILDPPRLLEPYENQEPKLLINLLLSLIASFTVASITVFSLEKLSPKVTFIDLTEESQIIKNLSKIDFINLDLIANKQNLNEVNLLSLAENRYFEEFKDHFQNYFNVDVLKINKITNELNEFKDHISNIKNANAIILIVQVAYSEREQYDYLVKLAQGLNKNIISTFFIDK